MAATTRVAIGSILETISNTANSISALVNTGARSISMLDSFVSKAQAEQKMSHQKDVLSFQDNLLATYAEEDAERILKADEFCDKSARHKELYENAHNRLFTILNPSKDSKAA